MVKASMATLMRKKSGNLALIIEKTPTEPGSSSYVDIVASIATEIIREIFFSLHH